MCNEINQSIRRVDLNKLACIIWIKQNPLKLNIFTEHGKKKNDFLKFIQKMIKLSIKCYLENFRVILTSHLNNKSCELDKIIWQRIGRIILTVTLLLIIVRRYQLITPQYQNTYDLQLIKLFKGTMMNLLKIKKKKNGISNEIKLIF